MATLAGAHDEVFIVADESLLVLDASTGALAHRLHRF